MFLGIGFAILFELIQNLIPYRTYNYLDMLFNIVGILFSFILIHLKAFKNEK
jgi:VanZ family protein